MFSLRRSEKRKPGHSELKPLFLDYTLPLVRPSRTLGLWASLLSLPLTLPCELPRKGSLTHFRVPEIII